MVLRSTKASPPGSSVRAEALEAATEDPGKPTGRSVSGPVLSRGEGSFDKLRTNGEMGTGRTGKWGVDERGERGRRTEGVLRSVSGPVVSRGEGSFDKLRTNGNMGMGERGERGRGTDYVGWANGEMGGGRTGGEGTANGGGP